MLKVATSLILLGGALASPAVTLEERQGNCPPIHIFGARETTVSPGYGTAGVVVNLVLNAHPGSTAEPISYPACGGQSSCGGASYASSVQQGTAAVASAVNSFNSRCPNSKIVLVGYSQGGQIFDNAFCGGGDPGNGISNTAVTIQASAVNMIKAAIFMGDPRYIAGKAYNVGTCTNGGFAARPASFTCPSGSKVKSYCDSTDPYCCNGNDANSHQQYGSKYGQQALSFINAQLNSGGTTNPQPTSTGGTTTPTNPPTGGGGTVAHWGQCGGQGWTGGTTCVSPYTCKSSNPWYSQCL